MGLRILVVEDDVVNRRFLGEWIISHKHQCNLTGSLAESRREIAHHRFDLCLIDLRLPDGNGRELQALLPEGTQIRWMSGDRPGPGDDWLAKPLDLSALDRLLRGIMPHAMLVDPPRAQDLVDLDDAAAGTALGAGVKVLDGLRQLMQRELQRDRVEMPALLAAGNQDQAKELLHRLKSSAALCGLPRLHSATLRLHECLDKDRCHQNALQIWADSVERAIKVIPRGP